MIVKNSVFATYWAGLGRNVELYYLCFKQYETNSEWTGKHYAWLWSALPGLALAAVTAAVFEASRGSNDNHEPSTVFLVGHCQDQLVNYFDFDPDRSGTCVMLFDI